MSLHTDMTEQDYRALPGLSGTAVGAILTSPRLYKWRLDHPTPATDAMALGTLFHALTLDQPHAFVVSVFDDFRSKAAQEWRDMMLAQGKVPLKDAVFMQAALMAEALKSHRDAGELLALPGDSEVSVTWDENGVPCKGRVDRLAGNVVMDVKSTRSLDGFDKSMGEFAYHAQQVHYRRGVIASGLGAGPRPFLLVCESDAPYRVQVFQVSEADMAQGEAMCAEAYRRWADCTAADVWPDGVPEGVTQTSIPSWSARTWDNRIAGA